MSQIMIVCDNIGGHRLMYARLLVEVAQRHGMGVTLLVPRGAGTSEEYQEHFTSLPRGKSFALKEMADFQWQSVRHAASGCGAARTVFPDGDHFALMAAFGSWDVGSLSFLLMRGYPRRSTMGYLAYGIKRFCVMLSKARGREWLKLVPGTRISPTGWEVADPVSVAEHRVPPIHLENGYLWVAVLGGISKRKNVPLLAHALAQIEKPVGMILAGRIEPADREDIYSQLATLDPKNHPVQIVDRTLAESELDGLVEAADAVVVAHSNPGPSGLVARCAKLGTVVVTAGPVALDRDVLKWEGLRRVPLTAAGLKAGLEGVIKASKTSAMRIASADLFAHRLLGISARDGGQ